MGGLYYKMMGGTNWTANVLLCAGLFCAPVLGVFAYLNTVAIFYRVRTRTMTRSVCPTQQQGYSSAAGGVGQVGVHVGGRGERGR